MKRLLLLFVALSFVSPGVKAGNDNETGHHDSYHHRGSESEINDMIYDLSFPWPFRKKSDGRNIRVIFLDTGKLTVYDIVFDTGKASIKSGARGTLRQVGLVIEDWPQLRVEIAGHTDSTGDAAFNKDLSQRRAESVRAYLLRHFDIEKSQLKAVGYGEDRPIASNDTAEGRAKNRRVEFRVLNKETLKKSSARR